MKQVTVSGAIILRTNPESNKKEIFATQRGYGDYKDGWEFPDGKLETEVCAERILGVVDYDYPTFQSDHALHFVHNRFWRIEASGTRSGPLAFKRHSAFCRLAAC